MGTIRKRSRPGKGRFPARNLFSDTMPVPNRVRGMQDILGEQQRYFTFIKKVARHVFRRHGFTRITTPVLEMRELIARSAGESSDVVSKEMYELTDRKGRNLVLKPESTAGVMRAYLENFANDAIQPHYLYYIEPHFRYDRPQKGRYRQFNQVGCEVIGECDPVLDAECIHVCRMILDSLGLSGFKLKINTLGTAKEREKYREEVRAFFEKKKHLLDESDAARLVTNPLRILDSKNPDVREMLPFAPKLMDFLKKDSVEFYRGVKEYLDLMGIPYAEDPTLVRGLDYYCHTVWEFVDDSGKSQDALGGGGRYDELSVAVGHDKAVPGVGFAFGMERLVGKMMERGLSVKSKDVIHLYLIQVGDEAKKVAMPLAAKAREAGINTLASFGTSSMSSQLKKADRLGAKFVAIVGVMEARKGVCQLKDMEKGTQVQVPLAELLGYVIGHVGEKALDTYEPRKELVRGAPIASAESDEGGKE